MKRLAALFLLALVPAGCLTMPTAPWQQLPPSKPIEADVSVAPPPVVQPDQVTPQTAQDAVQALRNELDHDARQGKK